MIILGAGMAGCITSIVNPNASIVEASKKHINNHGAVLRFRTDSISKITGIPFKEVTVYKSIWYNNGFHPLTPKMSNLYSQKVLGAILGRSINKLDTVTRYIAPSNFHELLIDQCKNKIQYSAKVNKITKSHITLNDLSIPRNGESIVSTMPIVNLSKAISVPVETYEIINFNFKEIYTTRIHISDCDVCQTIYYPDQNTSTYRATLTGSDLIIESMKKITNSDVDMVFESFGIIGPHKFQTLNNSHNQKYGKIQEINEQARRNFILRATLEFNIYSLGRFATWRNILLDDVLFDIYMINKLIHSDMYTHHIVSA